MATSQPNILLIMTDEERYPPPYEQAALAEFRRNSLPAHERIRAAGRELHRHYVGSTACAPSRTTMFTGQYPSLHGVINTDGLAKPANDPAMSFLDPDTVPTMGDWFRAAGYETHYRGKWHISHADLLVSDTHERLRTNDSDGRVDPAAVALYEHTGRLEPFGFSGWIGREPHGAAKEDTGLVRDELYAEQVTQLFAELAKPGRNAPWLTVASFVNPHDIAFVGATWDFFGMTPPDDAVPEVARPPSQSDSFDGRPSAQRDFHDVWPRILYEQASLPGYARLYQFLIKMVDTAIMRILDALEASGLADDTIIVFTSDHGDLVGAHGGLVQKWHNAFDEAVRVPLMVSGGGIDPADGGIEIPTSHVDLLPTLLGLAGIDQEAAATEVARDHIEAQPLPGRDLSPMLYNRAEPGALEEPIYFMTEDQVSVGTRGWNRLTREPYTPVGQPAKVESVIASRPTGPDGAAELWKLNHYYERLVDWEESHGIAWHPPAPEPVESQWEMHNLTADPEERTNLANAPAAAGTRDELERVLDAERATKRHVPKHRN